MNEPHSTASHAIASLSWRRRRLRPTTTSMDAKSLTPSPSSQSRPDFVEYYGKSDLTNRSRSPSPPPPPRNDTTPFAEGPGPKALALSAARRLRRRPESFCVCAARGSDRARCRCRISLDAFSTGTVSVSCASNSFINSFNMNKMHPRPQTRNLAAVETCHGRKLGLHLALSNDDRSLAQRFTALSPSSSATSCLTPSASVNFPNLVASPSAATFNCRHGSSTSSLSTPFRSNASDEDSCDEYQLWC